jgi:hypothetical protein
MKKLDNMWLEIVLALMLVVPAMAADLTLVAESGKGKMYSTGEGPIFVLQLQGSWFEMGQQYGDFAKDKVQGIWGATVKPVLEKKWLTEKEALDLFGKRILATSSHRRQELYRGIADSFGWPVEKVVLLDGSMMLSVFQAKQHSMSGCSSMTAWGDATTKGQMVTGRNMDWFDPFVPLPLFLTVYKPADGSNSVANLNWAGWVWAATAVNDKGVYLDIHDGTSMGGSVVSADRPSFLGCVLDFLFECDTAEALGMRYNGTRTDVSTIWMIADRGGTCFSMEASLYDSRRREPQGSTFVTVNSFLNPDWGLYVRDTVSNSLTRLKNLEARAAEAQGKIDAAKMREIFDLRLFNEDGTFKKNGGATKPTTQDADLTCHQMVTDLSSMEIWLKVPQKTDWRHVDLKMLFSNH